MDGKWHVLQLLLSAVRTHLGSEHLVWPSFCEETGSSVWLDCTASRRSDMMGSMREYDSECPRRARCVGQAILRFPLIFPSPVPYLNGYACDVIG